MSDNVLFGSIILVLIVFGLALGWWTYTVLADWYKSYCKKYEEYTHAKETAKRIKVTEQ